MSVREVLPAPSFRPMRFDDLDAVLAIEQRAYPHPWSPGIFQSCLKVGYPSWVMERGGAMVGYGLAMIQVGECHILNIAIDPDHQGQGLGRQMLRFLLDLAIRQMATSAFLEVRESNTRAIRLYESEGFNEIGRRKGYYPADEGREDALVLGKELF